MEETTRKRKKGSKGFLQRRPSHRYRGHRADSFRVPDSDLALLVELRARQRTFNGAYARTAMGNLGYALTILKLFDHRFYRIGLLFAILGACLFAISFMRDRHSRHDFADPREDDDADSDCERFLAQNAQNAINEQQRGSPPTPFSNLSISFNSYKRRRPPVPDFTQQPCTGSGKRIFGRPFITAGWIVIALATVVCLAEIGLLVLIINL